jgi:hypothetical protein
MESLAYWLADEVDGRAGAWQVRDVLKVFEKAG